MAKFLYGAAVQGIQGFIFQTNKLSEIVGASELVEKICTEFFEACLPKKGKVEKVLSAAGNIKYIFEEEKDCREVVKTFPRKVVNLAPGITISQAVVKMDDYEDFAAAVNELESRLRTQRNKPMNSMTIGLMGIKRSAQTGLPVVDKPKENGKDAYLDDATWAKLYEYDKESITVRKRTTKELCKKAFDEKNIAHGNIAYDIEDITGKNDWIAIIHADGNGLGQIVQKIGTDKDRFSKFSVNLDKATTEAAVAAYEAVKGYFEEEEVIPIRPIVLGGDDLTVICRADLAIPYAKAFLENFEQKTKQYLSEDIKQVFTEGKQKDCLTACAGIAFVKSSYPFYYGYELAEALCSRAKKDAKNKDSIRAGRELPQSCLLFHKVQSSFVEQYDEIVKKELSPKESISFEFGPYYLWAKEERWTIDELVEKAEMLDSEKGNAIKSHLRQWMTLLHKDEAEAKQHLNRLLSQLPKSGYEKIVYREEVKKMTDSSKKRADKIVYPVYDILALHTINTQTTK